MWFCGSTAFVQVTGNGVPGFVSVWKTKTSLADSLIFQKGSQLGVGTKTPSAEVDVESSSTTESAILVNNTATSGTPSGVTGMETFSGGVGLLGINNATNGGSGILGISNATSGFATGVLGQTSSPGGYGVFGSFTAQAIARSNSKSTQRRERDIRARTAVSQHCWIFRGQSPWDLTLPTEHGSSCDFRSHDLACPDRQFVAETCAAIANHGSFRQTGPRIFPSVQSWPRD